MSATLFSAATLSGSFQPSKPVMIQANTVTLNFTLVVTGPATVQWFMEFCEGNPTDPTTQFFREVAEEDAGQGVVLMPEVIRTFADNASTTLSTGTHASSNQFNRRAQFVRVQMRVTAGTAVVTLTDPFGLPV